VHTRIVIVERMSVALECAVDAVASELSYAQDRVEPVPGATFDISTAFYQTERKHVFMDVNPARLAVETESDT
jgi:hypothetical protein